MEDEANISQKILWDNIDNLINISLLSTPKSLNSDSSLTFNKENTPTNDSYITQI